MVIKLSAFSPEVYPPSVTKLKKRRYKTKAPADVASFCLSSDSESDNQLHDIPKPKLNSDTKRQLTSHTNSTSSFEGYDSVFVPENNLFKTPIPLRKKVLTSGSISRTNKTNSDRPTSSVSSGRPWSESSSDEEDLIIMPSSTGSVNTSSENDGFKTPKLPGSRPRISRPDSVTSGSGSSTPSSTFVSRSGVNVTGSVKKQASRSFLESLSNVVPDECRDPLAKR